MSESQSPDPAEDQPEGAQYEMADPTTDRTLMLAQIGELTMRLGAMSEHLRALLAERDGLRLELEAVRALREPEGKPAVAAARARPRR